MVSYEALFSLMGLLLSTAAVVISLITLIINIIKKK